MESKQKPIAAPEFIKALMNDFSGEAIFNIDDDLMHDALGEVKTKSIKSSNVFLSVGCFPKDHWVFINTKLKFTRLPYSEIEIVNYQNFLGGGFKAYVSQNLISFDCKIADPDNGMQRKDLGVLVVFTNEVNGRDGILIGTKGPIEKEQRDKMSLLVVMLIEMVNRLLDTINNPTIVEVDTVKRAANLMINPQHEDFKKLSKSTILHTVRRKAVPSEDGEKRNGTEKSPHLRRGHLRTYKSGKTAWVKSSSVKNHDGSAKLYAVKK